MNEDRVLREMARLAHEETEDRDDAVPAHWQALAKGTLPASEVERLEAEAARSPEGDPEGAAQSAEARAALEVFRPLGEGFEARMVAEIRALEPAAEKADTPRVLPFPRRRHLRTWMAAAAAVATLAFGLYWFRPADDLAVVPAYGIEVRGIEKVRAAGGEDEGAVLAPGAAFRIRLRPEVEVGGAVETRAFVTRDDVWRPWPIDFKAVGTTGFLEAEGTLEGDLLLASGPWTLVVVVGPRRGLPSNEDFRTLFDHGLAAPAADAAEAPWRLLQAPLTVEPSRR